MPGPADTLYPALAARDRRFDGLFYVGVRTTGVYCRPVCPARTPRRDRCAFFATAAAAEAAGFRACFRCRPELAPGHGPMDAVPRLVAEATARIDAGFLNEGSVEALAEELGVSARHLRRAMEETLGLGPVALAQSRRLALAKQLLTDTTLSVAEVAFASGFASVRRFNALVRARFGRPPSLLRRRHAAADAGPALRLRLDYRPPLDWAALCAFFAQRAVPRVEAVADGAYARTVSLDGHTGWVVVRPDPARPALLAEVAPALAPVLMPLRARLRALFDLDACPDRVAAQLGRDRRLAPLVARRPGLRVPGALDGFEAAVRAVLGQQISVRGAATLAGRLAARFGAAVAADGPAAGLDRAFPDARSLTAAGAAGLAQIGLTGARARSLAALARAAAAGRLPLDRPADPERARAALEALPGIGPWTSAYVAMRALGWPDALPSSDLGLRKALGGASPAEVERLAEAWRPWRAYALMHLWSAGDEALTRRA